MLGQNLASHPDDVRRTIGEAIGNLYWECTLRRDRGYVLITLCVVILAGLGSRRYPGLSPSILSDYPGDAFWAMAAYLAVLLVRPGVSIVQAALAALTISFAVEFSQIYHDQWIDAVRRTLFGRLILGSGFDPLDLIAYVTGVIMISALDAWIVIYLSTRKERNGR